MRMDNKDIEKQYMLEIVHTIILRQGPLPELYSNTFLI